MLDHLHLRHTLLLGGKAGMEHSGGMIVKRPNQHYPDHCPCIVHVLPFPGSRLTFSIGRAELIGDAACAAMEIRAISEITNAMPCIGL
jgi:hypothetical protein